MNRPCRFLNFAICWLSLAVGWASVASGQQDQSRGPLRVTVKPEALSTETLSLSFAPVFKKVAPSVVTITSTKTVREQAAPFMRDPFFRRFFGFGDEEEDSRRK